MSGPIDAESRLDGAPRDSRPELRLWLRLLTLTTLIEREIRRRLAEGFAMTLPRFDLMAQLDKAPDGLTLGEVSRRMMVTNGNVTGLVDRLVEQGLVTRRRDAHDGRVQRIALTPEGRKAFAAMAAAHGAWIAELIAELSGDEREALMALLARTKHSVALASSRAAPRAAAE